MALKSSSRKAKPLPTPDSSAAKFMKNPKLAFALTLVFMDALLVALTLVFMDALLVALTLVFMDALLVALIIAYVPYTKIDWDAYMSQVSGFLQGERDYRKLKGDTGPLVYPAGFLYVYSAIQYVTGGEVYPAQILFGMLYIMNLAVILSIYVRIRSSKGGA